MKQSRVLLSSFITVITFPVVPASLAETAATQVAIVENGRSDWQIVNAAPRSAATEWAAGELQKYVRQMSGVELLVGNGQGDEPAIIVGLRSELAERESGLLPPPATGHDGYAVAVVAGNARRPAGIIIAGDNRVGTIYGVYDVLERLGCRWFYPTQDPADPEVVPQKDDAVTCGRDMGGRIAAEVPHLQRQRVVLRHGPGRDAAKQLDWAMKNRYNAMGWQSETQDRAGRSVRADEVGRAC